MAVLTPHFDIPFTFINGTACVVEQDSYADLSNCAEAIIRTPQGLRLQDDRGDFGIAQLEFSLNPIDPDIIRDQVVGQDQRVTILTDEESDQFNQHIEYLRMELWATSGSQ